jgi:hypothetical protein
VAPILWLVLRRTVPASMLALLLVPAILAQQPGGWRLLVVDVYGVRLRQPERAVCGFRPYGNNGHKLGKKYVARNKPHEVPNGR